MEFVETGGAARIINRSNARVHQLADAGVLPVAARTERGGRLFRREDVERYVADRAARLLRKDSAVADKS
jgi:hypothetical protein